MQKKLLISTILLSSNLLFSHLDIYRYNRDTIHAYCLVHNGMLTEAYYFKSAAPDKQYIALTSPAIRTGEPMCEQLRFIPRLGNPHQVTYLKNPKEIYLKLCNIFWNPSAVVKIIHGLPVEYSIDNFYLKSICNAYRK